MEFRKMVMITLYARQQKRHRCIEQSFGLCGRGRGWDHLGEWHWNTYNIIYETSHYSLSPNLFSNNAFMALKHSSSFLIEAKHTQPLKRIHLTQF